MTNLKQIKYNSKNKSYFMEIIQPKYPIIPYTNYYNNILLILQIIWYKMW